MASLSALLCVKRSVALGALVVCAACGVSADHLQISESGYGAYEVSLSPWSDGLIVAWYDTRDGNAEIYLRRVDAEGRGIGPEHRLTDDPEQSYEADIDAAGDRLAVVWYDKDAEGVLTARLAFWSVAEGLVGQTVLSATGGATRNPVVRTDGAERVFVAWIEADGAGGEAVWGGWWSVRGDELEAPVEIGPAGSTTWNLNAEIYEAGVAYVVFDAQIDTLAEELYVARLDGTRVEIRRATDDDGHRSKYPDLAIDGGRAALTWFDERDGQQEVYLFSGTLDALISLETSARRITNTPGPSIGAYVAWNTDRIGLTWCDATDGAHDVYFQAFDVGGEPVRPAQRVTTTPESSLIPAIRPWQDGFAVAWNELAPGPSGMHDAATRSEVRLAIVR